MRRVNRQWYMIISDPGFVTTHLLGSSSCLLVQFPTFRAQHLDVREYDVKLSDINFQFPGHVVATCNGLALVRDRRYKTTHGLYYIANPVTNRIMILPTLPLNVCRWSLAFAASSNTYKVVVVTKNFNDRCKYECAILTVNVDKAWRLINCADIDEFTFILRCVPIFNRGYVYWGGGKFSFMLALNIESESIKAISLPQVCRKDCLRGHFRPKVDTISYIHICGDFSIKLWILKDHETGDWIRSPDLIVEDLRREGTNVFSKRFYSFQPGDRLVPICWSKNEEKILFRMKTEPNSLLVYDVQTGGTFTVIMDIDGGTRSPGVRPPKYSPISGIFPHVRSLTWVDILFVSFASFFWNSLEEI